MGLLDAIWKRNSELEWMYDLELIEEKASNNYMKRLAINVCINKIAVTISQSKFDVVTDKRAVKDNLVYLLNHRANKNLNASRFWQVVIYKLIYDNEVLIIKTDDDELLIADDFEPVYLGLS